MPDTSLPGFPAVLTHLQAPAYLTACEQVLQGVPPGGRAQVSAAALQRFDSSALAVWLGLLRAAQARGLVLECQAVPPRLQGLAQLYGLGALLPG